MQRLSTLGDQIKLLREQAGWRQVDLGKAVGVTGSAVTQWEKGNRCPDPQMLGQLADRFGVSVDYLLGRTADPRGHVAGLSGAEELVVLLHGRKVHLSPREIRTIKALLGGDG